MIRHTAWLAGIIQTIPALANKTFVTLATGTPAVEAPYVVLHPSDGVDEQMRFSGPRSTINPRFTIHSVGTTAFQAASIAEAVRAKLVVAGFGIVPAISSDRSRRVWYDVPTPIQLDEDASPPLFLHVAECGWQADLI